MGDGRSVKAKAGPRIPRPETFKLSPVNFSLDDNLLVTDLIDR